LPGEETSGRRRFNAARVVKVDTNPIYGVHYRILSLFGPRDLAGLAIGAGIATGLNVPEEWGEGGTGYSLHYANGFEVALTRQTFAWGLDSAFHEDRYVPSEDHRFLPRVENVLKQVLICKKGRAPRDHCLRTTY
jgi:hypothetical protein